VERLVRPLSSEKRAAWQAGSTTFLAQLKDCPQDYVQRHFQAKRPNILWVSDFPFASTPQAQCMWPL